MRAPAFDTLKLSGLPQNPHTGDVIALLKGLPLSSRYDGIELASSTMERQQAQEAVFRRFGGGMSA